ncbi:hypothetical protein RS130_13060 [Paraglaciecola aquimarina]|uniref:Peptidase M61 catalytic domain-containing protein n=1 Tax=Paraglaciecola aquimarina TaxID=1235557 RepID=A0ABU3SXH4_9ALTE|nr:hypothetical protein [Paraglaciecola aquimarina]MDU0354720.1 hypothetical protein [Paraglaciecola aquimarina]
MAYRILSKVKKSLLTEWVTKGVNATRATLGVYPNTLNFYLYPKKAKQPVPWAHTRRDEHESVHLYVDSRFPLDKFIKDWTIYHEIAHLAIPYLGSKYSWLSEGFASFMQYQIMHQAGILAGSLHSNYHQKISPHLRWFNSELTAASIAQRLMKNEQYPAAYWGSAYFFVLADKQLRQAHQVNLVELISHYQDCCRQNDNNVHDLMQSLDNMLETKILANLLQQYENAAAKTLYPEHFE